jgi:hypothetical protein
MLKELRDRMKQGIIQGAQGLDRGIQVSARRGQRSALNAGIGRGREYLMTRPTETVVDRIGSDLGLDEAAKDALRTRLQDPWERSAVANEYARRLKRGPFPPVMEGGTQMGFGEAVYRGIAENKYIRRGLLPTAIGGGGLLAGAAVTTGAQNLMALMQYMQAGDQQQERVEESPLA